MVGFGWKGGTSYPIQWPRNTISTSPCLNYRIRVEGWNQIPNPNKKIDVFVVVRVEMSFTGGWIGKLVPPSHPDL
jgi:hypothetical protein